METILHHVGTFHVARFVVRDHHPLGHPHVNIVGGAQNVFSTNGNNSAPLCAGTTLIGGRPRERDTPSSYVGKGGPSSHVVRGWCSIVSINRLRISFVLCFTHVFAL